jgi:hypothetical protein
MGHTVFSVQCGGCGNVNRPSKSPAEGIKMILNGDFRACRHCGTEFARITVPARPLVLELAQKIPAPHWVRIARYQGRVPMAIGSAQ